MYFCLAIFIVGAIFVRSEVLLRNRVASVLCSQLLEYKSLRVMTKPVVKGSGILEPTERVKSWIMNTFCDSAPKPKSCFPFKYKDGSMSLNRTKETREIPDITNPVGDHPCLRQCSSDPAQRLVCYYKWELSYYWSLSSACGDCPKVTKDCFNRGCIPLDGTKRPMAVINHKFPGPPIRVCEGDTIIVDVQNGLMFEGTAIHWHGLVMKGTPWMDGVPQLTQCYIAPGTTFRYEFEAAQTGTHFYHSHAGFQRADGLFGGLVIRQPGEREPFSVLNRNIYDFDLPEHEILLIDWKAELTVSAFLSQHFAGGSHKPHNILVNGKGFPFSYFDDFLPGETIEQKGKPFVPVYELRIAQGKRYRVRLISNGVLKCPLVTSIASHTMLVIASDGYDLTPYLVESLVIYAGERWDVVVTGDQQPGSYWIKFQGIHDCNTDISQLAVLNYKQIPKSTVPSHLMLSWNDTGPPGLGIQLNPFNTAPGVPGQSMSTAELSILNDTDPEIVKTNSPDHQFYISYDFNSLPKEEVYFPGKSRVFDMKSDRVGRTLYAPQLNLFSGVLPSVPPLTQPESISEIGKCNSDIGFRGLNCSAVLCQCTHWLQVKLNSIVELVIIDEGKAFSSHHPFHLHGHSFRVVGQEILSNTETGASSIRERDRNGLLRRRNESAVTKDVLPVPSPGYAIIRFRADNPGMWYFHCHIEFHVHTGMSLVIQVGELDEMPPPPNGFPKCGNFKYSQKQPPSYLKSCRPLPGSTYGSPSVKLDNENTPWCGV